MPWKTGRNSSSIATRLTIWYALTLMVMFISAIVAVHLSLNMDSENEIEQRLEKGLNRIHSNRDLFLQLVESDGEDSLLRLIDPDGKTIFESRLLQSEFPALVFPPVNERVDTRSSDGTRFSLLTRQIEGWTYQCGFNRTEERSFLILLYRNVAIVAIPLLLIALLAGYLLTRSGLKPLRRLAAEMQSMSSDRLDRRVSTDGIPRELSKVAGSFNQVMGRLSTAVERLDQFSADVAHELRTPVHNLRTAAELALGADRSLDDYRQVLHGVVDEADRLARLIDRLLLLARLSDPRTGLVRESADLATELETICDFFEPAAAEAGVAISVVAPAGLTHSVDRALLQRAVSNLVANAVAHTLSGGRVELRAISDPNGVTIEVCDTGCGIPEDALPHLFDRYYRPLGSASKGMGLGLAIVKRVAELHGGKAAITSELDRGTRVRLTFPNVVS
jgi:two-component system, OmpR family, heavy metal sensor histidine kinase CusS